MKSHIKESINILVNGIYIDKEARLFLSKVAILYLIVLIPPYLEYVYYSGQK